MMLQDIGFATTSAKRQLIRGGVLQVLNYLRMKPYITINDKLLGEMDMNTNAIALGKNGEQIPPGPTWPADLLHYNGVINDILTYRDVPLSMTLNEGFLYVKLSFPNVRTNRFHTYSQWSYLDHIPGGGWNNGYYTKNTETRYTDNVVSIHVYNSLDELYNGLEEKYKLYSERKTKAERTNKNWDDKLKAKKEALVKENEEARANMIKLVQEKAAKKV